MEVTSHNHTLTDGLFTYWSLRIPYTDHNPTKWHPTERTGPFSVLSSGAFATRDLALAWARENLGPHGWTACEVSPRSARLSRIEWRVYASWGGVFYGRTMARLALSFGCVRASGVRRPGETSDHMRGVARFYTVTGPLGRFEVCAERR